MNDPRIARSFYTDAVATEHYLGIRWPVAIWTAVLRQAVDDILYRPALDEIRGMTLQEAREFECALRAAAERWVDDEADEPRRFVWVCREIGLDPSAVRRAIRERRQPL